MGRVANIGLIKQLQTFRCDARDGVKRSRDCLIELEFTVPKTINSQMYFLSNIACTSRFLDNK